MFRVITKTDPMVFFVLCDNRHCNFVATGKVTEEQLEPENYSRTQTEFTDGLIEGRVRRCWPENAQVWSGRTHGTSRRVKQVISAGRQEGAGSDACAVGGTGDVIMALAGSDWQQFQEERAVMKGTTMQEQKVRRDLGNSDIRS